MKRLLRWASDFWSMYDKRGASELKAKQAPQQNPNRQLNADVSKDDMKPKEYQEHWHDE